MARLAFADVNVGDTLPPLALPPPLSGTAFTAVVAITPGRLRR